MIHRDIKLEGLPKVFVYGRPGGDHHLDSSRPADSLLPIAERGMELAGRPPAVALSGLPKYGDIVQYGYERLGFPPIEFRGYRLAIKHPPMNSSIHVQWDLEQHPG